MIDDRCTVGDLLSRCPQPRTDGSTKCYWHAKLEAGLFGCTKRNTYGCALPEGHRGNCDPVGEVRSGLGAADVFTDEQREIATTLDRMGATSEQVRGAIARDRRTS